MGFKGEQGKSSLPTELRAEQAGLILADRVENAMTLGAIIYSDGSFGGYGISDLRMPDHIAEELNRGRIVICDTKDVRPGLHEKTSIPWVDNQPRLQRGPRKALIIPEGTNQRLGYRTRPHTRHTEVMIVQGIDEQGKPVLDDLFSSYGFLRFLEKMAQRQLQKQGVEPNASQFSYRRVVVKKLEEMAKEENGGLGEVNKAVEKMKQEMQEAAEYAEKFVNGNNH